MRKIMIIRHGERPEGKVCGVKADGSKSSRDLTPRGWQRAGALVRYFNPRPTAALGPGLATPVAIFASRVENEQKSRRPRQTVTPLADALGLAVDRSFGHGSESGLVHAALKVPGPVLVCWHHEAIPALVNLFAPSLVCPQVWPDRRFDIVWVLDRDATTSSWTLTQVPQLLLAGDSPDVIA